MPGRREKLVEMLAANPTDSFLIYALALDEAGAGETAAATNRLRSLVQSDPSYVPTWFQLGRLLFEQGENDEASAVLQRGIEVAASAGDAHAASELRGLLAQITG